jgi:hypothetical protein
MKVVAGGGAQDVVGSVRGMGQEAVKFPQFMICRQFES